MARRSRLALLTAVVGLLVPVAASSTPAGAVDQDLQVSATSGAPGTTIELTSASCVSEGDGSGPSDVFRAITARLVVGTAPDEVAAGVGSAFEGEAARIVVPDWVDPDQPAVLEARCVELTFDANGEAVDTSTDFDPVVFDVLAGSGPSLQQRTFSRTSLKAGQAFQVSASGCTLPDATSFGVEVVTGADLTLRNASELVAEGGDLLGDDPQVVDVALAGGTYSITVSQSSGSAPVIESVEEQAVDIAPGTYAAYSYCSDEVGTLLLYQPQRIEVTGTTPGDDIDLTVPVQSHEATLAGGSCDQGQVRSSTGFESVESLGADFSTFDVAASPALAHQALVARALQRSTSRRSLGGAHPQIRSSRVLFGEDFLDVVSTPAADGSWSTTATAPFDDGVSHGYAECGDALGEGFVYDPQVALVRVDAQETTTSTTTTTTPPVPANAVPGAPSYAG